MEALGIPAICKHETRIQKGRISIEEWIQYVQECVCLFV